VDLETDCLAMTTFSDKRYRPLDNLTNTGGGSFRPRNPSGLQTAEYTGRQKGIAAEHRHIKVQKHEPLPMPSYQVQPKSSDGGREDSDEYHLPYDTIVDQQTRIMSRKHSDKGIRHDGNISSLNWSGRDSKEQEEYLSHKKRHYTNEATELQGGEGVYSGSFG
jgi:hypothetical protein